MKLNKQPLRRIFIWSLSVSIVPLFLLASQLNSQEDSTTVSIKTKSAQVSVAGGPEVDEAVFFSFDDVCTAKYPRARESQCGQKDRAH